MSEPHNLPEIEPLHQRWEPNPDPSSIVVPGVDSNAPIQDQLDQIEQLITIKLQNIDENFSRVAEILSTRILPSVKRFGANTEPIRHAANFWVSFFEKAAKTRIPTGDDFSYDTNTQEQEQDQTAQNVLSEESPSGSKPFNPDVTPSDSSFMPGQGAVSSTPFAGPSRYRAVQQQNSEGDSVASWAASIESPLDRLDREMQGLIVDNASQNNISSATPTFSSMHGSYTTEPNQLQTQPQPMNPTIEAQKQEEQSKAQDQPPKITSTNKGKDRGPVPTSLREFLLRQNLQSGSNSSQSASQSNNGTKSSRTSPLKIKKTPKRNPYIPPDVRPRDWDGIVDLAKPSTTPGRQNMMADSDSDSDIDMPPGMSPPVTISFGGLARLARSPAKAAAAKIGSDLIGDAERRRRAGLGFGTDTSQSTTTAPTPPSLSRYIQESSGSSMERNFGIRQPDFITNEDPIDDDSFDDSFEEGNTGAPSTAFLMASQRQRRLSNDSSNGSNQSSDSPSPDDGGQAGHPFAGIFEQHHGGEDDSFDDSLDYDDRGPEEPTVFGVAPAQRESMANAGGRGNQFRLLGEEILEDTIGIGTQRARAGIIDGTPTPWGTGRGT